MDEWFSEWIEAQRPHVESSTINVYEDARRRIIAALGKSKANGPLADVTSGDVRSAVTKISKKVKGATANMDLGAFRVRPRTSRSRSRSFDKPLPLV